MTNLQQATIIDAGIGNLGNVSRALRHLGAEPTVTDDPAVIAASRCLLLPGVGAFRPPRERLRGAREAAIREALGAGAWLLGICVGYQLLFTAGEEFGEVDGLGLLEGRVAHLPTDAGVALPHIGWNRLHDLAAHPLLAGLSETPAFYFVHSYAPVDVAADRRLARATHGSRFTAVAGGGRVLGTQFHPEKSGEAGLRLLGNYLELAAGGRSCS